ncbi:hypothetical protein EN962_07330 [Mesorhizobium sp. M7A.F.Ca.CA.001.09.2.1]|uniref:Uncharacterized protein n=1 Tax=Mesorhizobium ciceri biovar biserrulae (strain HAMBI 2942 / LMG 23838 / WSM1271) TaxID=765698 RepID=E8TP77_MESCW|nr:hypothetical protein Mesci_6111 [Mesorhizobium ciceri biovar biserrulae WSM1271]AMY04284.1 hypothetical protein A4R29_32035 [Mesorhizobium ciceri biovar biserrulae]RUY35358.1 hypothetical protein EN981_26525 [Mesorhizobium sp. M7A.F.Ca.CA.001.13.2.1]RUY61390.1 hypothetical protein EN965_27440 [Mesorhizobium sp. M7A.F.Ca.CA.001.05.1.1]RUY63304.1 hypothetical protein EN980_28360 [Mesorhizobium sp. M7A.F.Ca.CA.001.13.1.1]RUY79967.1 hypothetical protein EN962_07330 [Mesorhizobium sp. M7A.F.Ca.C
MVQLRYGLRQDSDESWTVFDVFTGQPADAWGAPAEYLDQEYAEDLVGILNAEDLKRRLSRGRVV